MHITTLCIPKMKKDVPRHVIREIIKKMNLGKIHSIVEKTLKHDKINKSMIIRVEIDPNGYCGKYMLNIFESGKNIRLVHKNSNSYWKLIRTSQTVNISINNGIF